MTIQQWNQFQVDTFVPPEPIVFKPIKPVPLGAQHDCGGMIFSDPGVFWGSRPSHEGVKCSACGKQGYIEQDLMCFAPRKMIFPAPSPH